MYCCYLLIALSIFMHYTTGNNVYSFEARDIYGDMISLEKYRGKVTLLVNVASECGYTDSSYKSLSKITKLYDSDTFNVLAFPSNEFGAQEPGSNLQILRFVEKHYSYDLDLFSKTNVNGENAHPLWKHVGEVTGMSPNWNFWKYLVNRDGAIIGSWGPWDSLDKAMEKIKEAIEKTEKPRRTVEGAQPPAPVKPKLAKNMHDLKPPGPPSMKYRRHHKQEL